MHRYATEHQLRRQLTNITDAEGRKRGERTGLDTPVVHAVNDDHSMLAIYCQCLSKHYDPPGSTIARLKLKGIDGARTSGEHVV